MNTPITYKLGNTTPANTRNTSRRDGSLPTKPSATSPLDTAPTYSAARAELSLIVELRAPCKVKCSVVNTVSNA